jgi:hypothetical protein
LEAIEEEEEVLVVAILVAVSVEVAVEEAIEEVLAAPQMEGAVRETGDVRSSRVITTTFRGETNVIDVKLPDLVMAVALNPFQHLKWLKVLNDAVEVWLEEVVAAVDLAVWVDADLVEVDLLEDLLVGAEVEEEEEDP